MEHAINERIKLIMNSYNYKSVSSFAKYINIAQTTLNDIVSKDNDPRFSTIEKIINAFPLISHAWLLSGTGEMFTEQTKEKDSMSDETIARMNKLVDTVLFLQETINEKDKRIRALENELAKTK